MAKEVTLLKHALKEVDVNLQRVQSLCPKKSQKAETIALSVSLFRDKVLDWYNTLESSDISSPRGENACPSHAISDDPTSLPMLSPVNSLSPSSSSGSPLESVRQCPAFGDGSPTTTGEATDSDSMPRLSSTPETCTVLTPAGAPGGKGFAFPKLTPAGHQASTKKSSWNPGMSLTCDLSSSPDTPYMESTPTTTIQLSPSHFEMDGDAGELAAGGAGAGENGRGGDSSIEDKLMSSLYVQTLSCKKGPRSVQKTKSDVTRNREPPKLDLSKFAKVFQAGKAAEEMACVYDTVASRSKVWVRDIASLLPHFEEERVNLMLNMLCSREYVEFVPNRAGAGGYWTCSS